MDEIQIPIHDGFISYQLVVLNMNDNLLCFYDSGGGGDSDTNESE